MVRMLILLKYLMLIEDIRLIVYTAMRLATPFLSILFTFYLLTYEYQFIGQWLFGGLVTLNDQGQVDAAGDALYLRINFNDFFGSLMVLNCMLITNNWNSFVDLFAYVYGNDFITKLYFTSFFYAVALIIMNIIISFVLEVYDDLGTMVEREM